MKPNPRKRGTTLEAPKAPKPGSIGKVAYEGTLPTQQHYHGMVAILTTYQGKETIVRVKPERLEDTLVRYGKSVVRVLGEGKALDSSLD